MNGLLLSLQGSVRRPQSGKVNLRSAKSKDMKTSTSFRDDRSPSDEGAFDQQGIWDRIIPRAVCRLAADGTLPVWWGHAGRRIIRIGGLSPAARRLPPAARRLPPSAKTCHDLPATASCEREVFGRGTLPVTTAFAGWQGDVMPSYDVRAGELNQRLSVGSRREPPTDWKNGAGPHPALSPSATSGESTNLWRGEA